MPGMLAVKTRCQPLPLNRDVSHPCQKHMVRLTVPGVPVIFKCFPGKGKGVHALCGKQEKYEEEIKSALISPPTDGSTFSTGLGSQETSHNPVVRQIGRTHWAPRYKRWCSSQGHTPAGGLAIRGAQGAGTRLSINSPSPQSRAKVTTSSHAVLLRVNHWLTQWSPIIGLLNLSF